MCSKLYCHCSTYIQVRSLVLSGNLNAMNFGQNRKQQHKANQTTWFFFLADQQSDKGQKETQKEINNKC